MTYSPLKPVCALLCAATALSSVPAHADALQPLKPYRAEMMITANGITTPAQMSVDGERMKMSVMDASGQVVTTIYDGNAAYALTDMGDRKIAVKTDIDGALDRMAFMQQSPGTKGRRKRLRGLTFCRVYTRPEGSTCLDRHNIPLEYIGKDGTTMVVNDLDKGRLAPGTFDIPSDYTVMDTSAMMRGFGLGDGAVDIGGITPDDFKSDDAVLGMLDGLLGQQIAKMPEEVRETMPDFTFGEVADVAATDDPQAMLDFMLGKQGIPAGTFEIDGDTTTAGMLDEMIGKELGSDWEHVKNLPNDPKFKKAKAEHERMIRAIENARANGEDETEALLRAQGMSASDATEGAQTMRDFMGAATGQSAQAQQVQRDVIGQVGGTIAGWSDCEARQEELTEEIERVAKAGGGTLTPAQKKHYEDEIGKVMACALGVDLSTVK